MSRSINIDHIKNYRSGGIDIPKQDIDQAIEEHKKSLKKKDEALRKIEEKTESLLKKSESKRQTKDKVKTKPRQTRDRNRRDVSYYEYKCMKGLKGLIINYIVSNYSVVDGIYECVLDNKTFHNEVKKWKTVIPRAIRELDAEGWIKIIHTNKNGVRIVEIDPNLYKLN